MATALDLKGAKFLFAGSMFKMWIEPPVQPMTSLPELESIHITPRP
jgi:hypothetical protein